MFESVNLPRSINPVHFFVSLALHKVTAYNLDYVSRKLRRKIDGYLCGSPLFLSLFFVVVFTLKNEISQHTDVSMVWQII